jgi:hypothetical protein
MIYIQTKQSVFPKAIYIGDKAELRCSFKSQIQILEAAASAQNFTQDLDYSLYDIKDIALQKGQSGQPDQDYYNLVITFVPWKTGKIQLPDFEIEGLGTIHFEAVEVLSLVEQENITDLRSYSSPLLLPGTTYKIYGSLAAFVILFILLIRLIIKWRSVVFWFNNTKLKRRYARSKKNTIKALKKLVQETSDSQISTQLQKIMREYLELRLNYPFTKKLTSEMSIAFDQASCGLADENRYAVFENIISIFVRTDYIRFSDSSDAKFEEGELSQILNNLIDDIEVIEDDKRSEEKGGRDA